LVGTAAAVATAAFSIRRIGWSRREYAKGSESLNARLTGTGLGRVANDIIRLAPPSIRTNCGRATDQPELPLGSSKLGGGPELRSAQNWPAWQGSPMAFVGQVNLADIAAHDEEGQLPHSGLLSFFCAVDGSAAGVMQAPDDPSSWMVSHFDGNFAALVRLPLPPELPERLHFPACQASFSREPTLPDVESREILSLGLSEPERHAYINVQTGADVGYLSAMNHHLLGYPYCLGGSPFITCYLKAHGIPHPYTIELQGTKEEREHKLRDVRDLQHKAEKEWRLLLQVFSNEEAQMDWGGGGVLHFCIPKEALARRDFDRVWVEMQFV
jgi:hypothetical protein